MFKPAKLALVFALSLIFSFQTLGQAQAQDQNLKPEKAEKSRVAIVLGGKRLGIVSGPLTKERSESLNLGEKRGVLVRDVIKDSSADKAGLKSGDVIIEIDGQTVESHGDIRRKMEKLDYGKTYALKVIRSGNPQQLNFTLEKSESDNFYVYGYGQNSEELKKALERSREALEKSKEARKKAFEESRKSIEKHRSEIDKARAEGKLKGDGVIFFGRPRLGVETQGLTTQLAKYFGVEKGVLISNVSENSAAAKAGLTAGDIIIEVNGVAIDDSGDLRREINKVDAGDLRLSIIRNRQRMELVANLEAKEKGGNFYFQSPSEFPNAPLALAPLEGTTLTIPELKGLDELKNLAPMFENFPELHFNFNADSLADFEVYL
jgi:C-terminal processing protease CtpA/Prc